MEGRKGRSAGFTLIELMVALSLVALLLTLTLLWSLALNPAWRTWQQAPAKQAELEQAVVKLQAQQAEIAAL